jgi:hypothetical protein
MRQYYSDEVAECLADYEMCQMLTILLKAALSDHYDFIACKSQFLTHSASVLAVITYATRNQLLEMLVNISTCVYPHYGLLASPSTLHREFANATIKQWGRPEGLQGASAYQPLQRWSLLQRVWETPAVLTDGVESPIRGARSPFQHSSH